MNDKRDEFLAWTEAYLISDPEAIPMLFKVAQNALRISLDNALEISSNMECILLATIAKKYPKIDAAELIIDKLKKIQGKSSIKWDSIIKQLEESLKND